MTNKKLLFDEILENSDPDEGFSSAENTDPETKIVLGILKSILSHLSDTDEMDYHFRECEGHDQEHLEELLKDLNTKEEWHTIYDSCYFPVSDGGSYSNLKVAQSTSGDCFYLAMSLYGCSGASALTEYFKVPLPENTSRWAW